MGWCSQEELAASNGNSQSCSNHIRRRTVQFLLIRRDSRSTLISLEDLTLSECSRNIRVRVKVMMLSSSRPVVFTETTAAAAPPQATAGLLLNWHSHEPAAMLLSENQRRTTEHWCIWCCTSIFDSFDSVSEPWSEEDLVCSLTNSVECLTSGLCVYPPVVQLNWNLNKLNTSSKSWRKHPNIVTLSSHCSVTLSNIRRTQCVIEAV